MTQNPKYDAYFKRNRQETWATLIGVVFAPIGVLVSGAIAWMNTEAFAVGFRIILVALASMICFLILGYAALGLYSKVDATPSEESQADDKSVLANFPLPKGQAA